MLVIAGQMISGVALDLALGAPGAILPRLLGVGLILAGMGLAQSARR
jgi:transporter family-2 protein